LDDKIERVRTSWSLAAAIPGRTAQIFYANLFRMDPSTKPLFAGDLDRQGRKLTQTLTFIVDNIEDPGKLHPAAIDLARRHVDYGVTRDQYASVGLALIETLRQVLGPAFSDDDAEAWSTIYNDLASIMVAATYRD
jgi:nitric oxide dioxygenase